MKVCFAQIHKNILTHQVPTAQRYLKSIIIFLLTEYFHHTDQTTEPSDQNAENNTLMVNDDGSRGSGSVNFDTREYKAKIKDLIRYNSATGLYSCLLCNQTSKQSSIISNHLEAKHLQMMQYQCDYCGKEFSTRVHRNVHVHRIHKEEHKIAKVFASSSSNATESQASP